MKKFLSKHWFLSFIIDLIAFGGILFLSFLISRSIGDSPYIFTTIQFVVFINLAAPGILGYVTLTGDEKDGKLKNLGSFFRTMFFMNVVTFTCQLTFGLYGKTVRKQILPSFWELPKSEVITGVLAYLVLIAIYGSCYLVYKKRKK